MPEQSGSLLTPFGLQKRQSLRYSEKADKKAIPPMNASGSYTYQKRVYFDKRTEIYFLWKLLEQRRKRSSRLYQSHACFIPEKASQAL